MLLTSTAAVHHRGNLRVGKSSLRNYGVQREAENGLRNAAVELLIELIT